MKTSILILLFSFYLFASCKKNDVMKESPIEENKMIAIMTDVYFLDAQFSDLNSYLKDSIVFARLGDILKTNGISLEQFKKAQAFYNENDNAYTKLEDGINKAIHEASMK